jgi:hypothetical protein
MNKKAIIYEYLDELKSGLLNDEELSADYSYHGQMDFDMKNNDGFWVSEVSSYAGSILYVPELNKFFYRGESVHGEFGKAEFELDGGLISLLPTPLRKACYESAERKTSITFLLPPNLLDLN